MIEYDPETGEVIFLAPELADAIKSHAKREAIDELHQITPHPLAADIQVKSSLVAMYCLWQDDDWIEASLASVYPYAKRVVVIFNEHPWAGIGAYDGTTEDLVRAFPDPENKIAIVKGRWDDDRWGGQLIQRSIGFGYCEPGDWLWLVDGDEVYWPESCEQIIAWAQQTQADTGRVPCTAFFQDCYTVGWQEHLSRLFRFKEGAHFVKPNEVAYQEQ